MSTDIRELTKASNPTGGGETMTAPHDGATRRRGDAMKRAHTWRGPAVALVTLTSATAAAQAPSAEPAAREPAPGAPAPANAKASKPVPAVEPSAAGLTKDETDDLRALTSALNEAIVTTASRSAERASTAPGTVTIVTAEDLRRYGLRSVDEALTFLAPGLFVSQSPMRWHAPDVGGRGVLLGADGARHVLVLVDGHIYNSQNDGQVWLDTGLGIPLEAISHIEIIVGPGSVLYGSNAMLGVVNVVTRKASDYGTTRVVAEGTLYTPMGAGRALRGPGDGYDLGYRYRLGAGIGQKFTLFGKDAEATFHGEWQAEQGPTLAFGPQQGGDLIQVPPGASAWGGRGTAAFDSPSLFASFRVGEVRATVQASHHRNRTPELGIFNDPEQHTRVESVRADVRHGTDLSTKVHLGSRLYADVMWHGEQSRWTDIFACLPEQLDGCVYQYKLLSRWIGLEEQVTVDWNLDSSFVTLVGGDFRLRNGQGLLDFQDRVTGLPAATGSSMFYDELNYLAAVFAQQTWVPTSWLSANVGLRLDKDELADARLSPRAALTFTPGEHTVLKVGYTEAFRAPTLNEFRFLDPNYTLPASALQPEIVRSFEAQALLRSDLGSLGVTGFVTSFESLIADRAATQAEFDQGLASGQLASSALPEYVAIADNIDAVRSAGATAMLDARPFEGASLGGSFTLANVRLTHAVDDGTPAPAFPTWQGNARAAYTLPSTPTTFALGAAYIARRGNQAVDGVVVPAPEQLDLRLTVTSTVGERLRLRGSAFYRASGDFPYLIAKGPSDTFPNNTNEFLAVYRLGALLGVEYALP